MSPPRPSLGATMLALRMRADAPAHAHAPARQTTVAGAAASAKPLPAYVTHTLARYRLLHDIPFAYLVPDMRLLSLESARFFTLDPEWLDALAEGALQAGAGGSRERRRAEQAGGNRWIFQCVPNALYWACVPNWDCMPICARPRSMATW